MDYEVVDLDDVSLTDLSEIEEAPPDLDIKPVGKQLGLSEMRATVWYFEPGEEIQYHAHSEQEELYFVLDGEFSLKLGRSGETEYVDADPGTFRFPADAAVPLGAPPVDDPGLDPHSLTD